MSRAIRKLGAIVFGLTLVGLLAVAINDAEAIPFIYQAGASIVLIVVGLIFLRRPNCGRPQKYEPLIR